MLIDTHSHLYDTAFDGDRDEALARAAAAGVGKILLPAIDSESHAAQLRMAADNPGICFPMMGLHPTSVNDNPRWEHELELVERYLAEPPCGVERFYGVGEIGLDFYWSAEWKEQQMEAFRRQIELSLKHSLPLAIHTREAWPQMAETLAGYRGRGLRGVMHAFAGEVEHYRTIRECGYFVFGIGGVVTYKNSTLPGVLAKMSPEDIVLETDCPYLTPVPFRGKRNESSYVAYVCDAVAAVLGLEPEAVERITTANAERIFGI